MGLLFSRVGTDTFYSSLDKQLGKINANVAQLKAGKKRQQRVWSHVRNRFLVGFLAVYFIVLAYAAWIMQRPAGTYTPSQHAKRIAPVFIAPVIGYLVYTVFNSMHIYLHRRADAQIKKHEARMRKIVSELKDSTRYQRTQQLLEKYDPDLAAAKAKGPAAGNNSTTPGGTGPAGSKGMMPRGGPNAPGTGNRAATVAATVVTGAGSRLSSAVGQIFAQAAQTLIADDPALLGLLKEVQAQATALERENVELRRALNMPPRGSPLPAVYGEAWVGGSVGGTVPAGGEGGEGEGKIIKELTNEPEGKTAAGGPGITTAANIDDEAYDTEVSIDEKVSSKEEASAAVPEEILLGGEQETNSLEGNNRPRNRTRRRT